jgi:23S rRNA (cytosine1962-C5)-methyltransferase
VADVRVTERGVAFLVRPWDGPDVGLYADMREVRARLAPHWGGRAVLNTFAYTGAFSVAAALGGATEVVSVDLSTPALERAEANFVANDLDPDAVEFLAEDTFKALDRFRRTGRDFDLVILDPPSFSRSDAGTWSAKRDWPRLVASACRVLRPDGWLVAASNQGEISPKEFTGLQLAGIKKAGRRGQGIHRLGQAPDFPAASWFPEGRYLKVDVWRILD